MSKASEFVDDLVNNPLTPEEIAERKGPRPELRLRADVPAVEIDDTTRVQDVMARLANEDIGSVALHDPNGGITVMVIPVERYLELVGTELATDPLNKTATLDGRITPTEAAIRASYVEQVNPDDAWDRSVSDPDHTQSAEEKQQG